MKLPREGTYPGRYLLIEQFGENEETRTEMEMPSDVRHLDERSFIVTTTTSHGQIRRATFEIRDGALLSIAGSVSLPGEGDGGEQLIESMQGEPGYVVCPSGVAALVEGTSWRREYSVQGGFIDESIHDITEFVARRRWIDSGGEHPAYEFRVTEPEKYSDPTSGATNVVVPDLGLIVYRSACVIASDEIIPITIDSTEWLTCGVLV